MRLLPVVTAGFVLTFGSLAAQAQQTAMPDRVGGTVVSFFVVKGADGSLSARAVQAEKDGEKPL